MISFEEKEKTRRRILTYCQAHPALQLQDLFKFLHQSAFGCEHMVTSAEAVTDYIREEYKSASADGQVCVEELDGDYSRVGLSYLDRGLSAETLGKLFFLSAKKESDGENALQKKLDAARELINEKMLPFSREDFEREVALWKNGGYSAVHHSEVYRKNYSPSYRVIAKRYVPFLPLFAGIDKLLAEGSARIAVEGGSASGKTTLSEMLKEIYGCTVFHMDDFFLRPEQRIPERYAEIGGNIDRERFLDEVLVPLERGEAVNYRRFDCSQMKLQPPMEVFPEKLTVIEGAYSMHPEFAEHYDLSVFLDVSSELQKERILKRNSPQTAKRFFEEWIPLENRYFSSMSIKERCTLCISIKA